MFFKKFKKENVEINEYIDNTQLKYDSSTRKNIQCMGMDFLLSHNFACITNKKEQWYEEDFACISAMVNGRPALIFSISVMYPESCEKIVQDKKWNFLETAKEFNSKGDLDLYLIGIGAINKDESRKGIFRVGDRYSIALGSLVLLKPSDDANLAMVCENPMELSSIDEEYWVVSKLKSKLGRITGYKRIGSNSSPVSENIIDHWVFKALIDESIRLEVEYHVFIDCYSKSSVKDKHPLQLAFFDFCD